MTSFEYGFRVYVRYTYPMVYIYVRYTTLTPHIKGNHRDIFQIYPGNRYIINSCNTGTSGLPDMYTRSPSAAIRIAEARVGFKAANRESFPYIMHIVDEPRKFSPSNVLTYTVSGRPRVPVLQLLDRC